jgi:hypothetical protein
MKLLCAAVVGLAVSFGVVGCGSKPPPKAPTDSEVMDSDGDGVGDKEDKCPQSKEDKRAPNPNDGCPSDEGGK